MVLARDSFCLTHTPFYNVDVLVFLPSVFAVALGFFSQRLLGWLEAQNTRATLDTSVNPC